MIEFIILWLICSIGAAGLSFAFFQDEFPLSAEECRTEDYVFSILWGILGGPLSLVTVFLFSGFAKYGWRLWTKKGEDK